MRLISLDGIILVYRMRKENCMPARGVLRLVVWGLVLALALGLTAGCAGEGDGGQEEEAQQAPQQGASSSSGAGQGLVGTWKLTHINGNPVLDQYRMTFSEDGTLTSTSTLFEEVGSELEVPPVQYSVLDDTHLQITPPEEEGAPYVQEYSLEGDTLTLYTPDPETPIEQTFERES
jgi:hypothetical protein